MASTAVRTAAVRSTSGTRDQVRCAPAAAVTAACAAAGSSIGSPSSAAESTGLVTGSGVLPALVQRPAIRLRVWPAATASGAAPSRRIDGMYIE